LTRNRLLRTPLAIAALAACMLAVTAASASATLTGAGSTLVAPILANWKAGFEKSGGTSIQYSAIGSGAGIAQITARTVDFGASDAPLTREQASSCDNCVTIPWALSATGVAYNLSGVNGLKLSGPVLAEIYLGKIKKWNDAKIKKLNKGKKLPATKITPVYRTDGSGDTYVFTDYLSKVSGKFRGQVGAATSVGFPVGVGAKGNLGLTNTVEKTPGAISYIAASYMIASDMQAAQVQNKAGKFVYPNLSNITAAAKVVKSVPSSNTVSIVNPPKSATAAWPLSTFTYAVVPKDASQKAEIKKFIEYAITKGQTLGASLDFPPMPSVVTAAAKRALGSL